MKDVASRLSNRVQLTTDGFHCYLEPVDAAFPHGIDYAMLVKLYGTDPMAEKRYSPSICLSAESKDCSRRSGSQAYQYQLRRTPEPQHAHGNPSIHAVNERILEEAGEPHPRAFGLFHAL
jgi:hypothetical protein